MFCRTELHSDIFTSDNFEEETLEFERLTITNREPDTSSRSTWFKHKSKKLEKSESVEVLNYVGEDNKLLRSPLKASAHLNGSSPQLSSPSLALPETTEPKATTPPASPQESPKFVKFRTRNSPNAAVSFGIFKLYEMVFKAFRKRAQVWHPHTKKKLAK